MNERTNIRIEIDKEDAKHNNIIMNSMECLCHFQLYHDRELYWYRKPEYHVVSRCNEYLLTKGGFSGMLTFYSTLDNLSVSLWWSVVIFTKSLEFTFTSKLKTVVHVHLRLLIFTKAFLTFHVNSVTNFCAYTMSFFRFAFIVCLILS